MSQQSKSFGTLLPLSALGKRICILGPSNSGKSTLANAIARKLGRGAVHLDQLRHLPGTDWRERPDEEFRSLHDAALLQDAWVIDGNYSSLLPQRLARASGLIMLDAPTTTSLWRYLRRAWFEKSRIGGLEGGLDSVKWDMLQHITVQTRLNRRRYAEMFPAIELPKVWLGSAAEMRNATREWNLGRHP